MILPLDILRKYVITLAIMSTINVLVTTYKCTTYAILFIVANDLV